MQYRFSRELSQAVQELSFLLGCRRLLCCAMQRLAHTIGRHPGVRQCTRTQSLSSSHSAQSRVTYPSHTASAAALSAADGAARLLLRLPVADVLALVLAYAF